MHWWLIVLICLAGIPIGWTMVVLLAMVIYYLTLGPIVQLIMNENYWDALTEELPQWWQTATAPYQAVWLRLVAERLNDVFGRPS